MEDSSHRPLFRCLLPYSCATVVFAMHLTYCWQMSVHDELLILLPDPRDHPSSLFYNQVK